MRFEKDDIATTHEEADIIMVQQAVQLAKSGTKSICVVSDDTDFHFTRSFLWPRESVL